MTRSHLEGQSIVSYPKDMKTWNNHKFGDGNLITHSPKVRNISGRQLWRGGGPNANKSKSTQSGAQKLVASSPVAGSQPHHLGIPLRVGSCEPAVSRWTSTRTMKLLFTSVDSEDSKTPFEYLTSIATFL